MQRSWACCLTAGRQTRQAQPNKPLLPLLAQRLLMLQAGPAERGRCWCGWAGGLLPVGAAPGKSTKSCYIWMTGHLAVRFRAKLVMSAVCAGDRC